MSLNQKIKKLRAALKYGGGLHGKQQMALIFCKHAGLLPYGGNSVILRVPTSVRNASLLQLRDNGPDSILFSEILAEQDYALLKQLNFVPEVIFDIGANIGLGSFYLRSLFPEARLIGFEPSPAERAILEQNYANWGNATAFPYAVANLDQDEVMFAVHADKTGGQHLAHISSDEDPSASQSPNTSIPSSNEWNYIPVLMRRMDRVLNEHSLPVPDLVKIDIEGAELAALEGFGNMLDKPRAYILETHSPQLHRDCINLLTAAGYQVQSEMPVSRDTNILLMTR